MWGKATHSFPCHALGSQREGDINLKNEEDDDQTRNEPAPSPIEHPTSHPHLQMN